MPRQVRMGRVAALTGFSALSIPPAPKLPRRLMVRLRTLTPSIVVRIHAGHPPSSALRQRPRDRVAPAGDQPLAPLRGHDRLEAVAPLPGSLERRQIVPYARCQ